MARLLVLIAVAGALGALARFLLSLGAQRVLGLAFPWGTLAVNVLGCFLLGALMQVDSSRGWLSPEARTVAAAGFLGALTTFSTFGFETFQLIEHGRLSAAAGNVAANVFLGLAALWAGVSLMRALY